MEIKEARKLMKEKFEEISLGEYRTIWHVGEIIMHCKDGEICFRPRKEGKS